MDSIGVFKTGLDRFAEWSGLRLNLQKSHLIISRSAQVLREEMLAALGFQEGILPMRYLGLPLLSSRLTIADCRPLLLKIDKRIAGWEGMNISYAGAVEPQYGFSGFTMVGYETPPFGQFGSMEAHGDPWHYLGPLSDTFPRGPRLLGIEESARLSTVISGGEWRWPLITDFECLEITHVLPTIHGGEDRIIWRFEQGHPTAQALYRLFDPLGPKVGWSSLLSGSLKIPRHLFILWLVILGKLATTDKPWERWRHMDTYSFSADLVGSVLQQFGVVRFTWPNRNWQTDVDWASQRWRGKHIVNMSYRVLLAVCVYHIWRERNLRRFEHIERTVSTMALLIVEDIRQWILSITLPISVSTRALYRLWRIPWPVEGETN
ncbi:UNVERIFIED_CONTAM: hypothetical protein Sindi_1279500 [Sesamum indicum]